MKKSRIVALLLLAAGIGLVYAAKSMDWMAMLMRLHGR